MSCNCPSVVALKEYTPHSTRGRPFTRFNGFFVRDRYHLRNTARPRCLPVRATFDHHGSRGSRGGVTSWQNIVTACNRCKSPEGQPAPRRVQDAPMQEGQTRPREQARWRCVSYRFYHFSLANHNSCQRRPSPRSRRVV
jgi:hypothetical protein